MDLIFDNGKCICPVCGHISKWTDCDRVHINCPACRDRPACRHLRSDPPVGQLKTTGKCRSLITLYLCQYHDEYTALTADVAMVLCCRLCGPDDGYEPH